MSRYTTCSIYRFGQLLSAGKHIGGLVHKVNLALGFRSRGLIGDKKVKTGLVLLPEDMPCRLLNRSICIPKRVRIYIINRSKVLLDKGLYIAVAGKLICCGITVIYSQLP